MANPVPKFYDATDATPAPSTSFGTLIPGVQTAEVELHLRNDALGVDPMTQVFVSVAARFPGETAFTQDNPVAAMAMVHVRAAGTFNFGVDTIADQNTVLTPVGKGRWLALQDIPAYAGRKLFFSIIPLPGIGNPSVEIKFIIRYGEASFPLEAGHFESGAQGIFTGYGDGSFTEIFSGAIATASGSPDNKVNLSDAFWVTQGYVGSWVARSETLDGNDGASVALASGQSYWDTITLGLSGTPFHHKSVKGTTPLSPSLRVAVPADERLVCYVERKFSGVINSGDIYQADMRYGFFKWSISGTTITVDPGIGIISNARVQTVTRLTASLTDNSDNYVWLLRTGDLLVTTGGPRPAVDQKALLLAYANLASGVVTASEDLRQWIGPEVVWLQMDFPGTLTAGMTSNVVPQPYPAQAYISMARPPILALTDSGTGSGSTKVDIEFSDFGGAWTSIYSSSGTVDRRLIVASAAGTPIATDSTFEDAWVRAHGRRYRAKVISVPGTSAPAGGCVRMALEVMA